MKPIKHILITLAAATAAQCACAQANLNATLPQQGASGATAAVDRVLETIAKNMAPAADQIDATAESNINRDVNISRSTGQLLRPVGYMQINDERAIFASEDGARLARLKEQSRFGVMRINKISEDGVDYTVSGKAMYAPLTYLAAEPPRAVQVTGASSASGASMLPNQAGQAAGAIGQVGGMNMQASPGNAMITR